MIKHHLYLGYKDKHLTLSSADKALQPAELALDEALPHPPYHTEEGQGLTADSLLGVSAPCGGSEPPDASDSHPPAV